MADGRRPQKGPQEATGGPQRQSDAFDDAGQPWKPGGRTEALRPTGAPCSAREVGGYYRFDCPRCGSALVIQVSPGSRGRRKWAAQGACIGADCRVSGNVCGISATTARKAAETAFDAFGVDLQVMDRWEAERAAHSPGVDCPPSGEFCGHCASFGLCGYCSGFVPPGQPLQICDKCRAGRRAKR